MTTTQVPFLIVPDFFFTLAPYAAYERPLMSTLPWAYTEPTPDWLSVTLMVAVTFFVAPEVSTLAGAILTDLMTGGVVSGVETTLTVLGHALFHGWLPPVGV